MRFYIFLLTCGLLVSGAAQAQKLEPFGLQGKSVTAMHYYWGSLYAATQNDGVYRRLLLEPDSGWVALGVPAKNLTAIFAFHTYCPLICWKGILVGSIPIPAGGDSALIYFYQQRPDTCTKKGRWTAADSGIDRSTIPQINALSGIDVCQPIGPTFVTAFAGALNSIWRSEDRGASWERVWQMSLANILAFATKAEAFNPFVNPHAGKVWAGGYVQENASIRKPLILHSFDSGERWEDRSPVWLMVSDECRALALDPADTNIVYAALMHAIIKTRDGGKNWGLTSLQNQSVTFKALAVNSLRPNHVVAGGIMGENLFALYESVDGGDNWYAVTPSSILNGVSSLIFDPSDSQNVYIATLGTGVYRYSGLRVGLDDKKNTPESFYLSPNFPNPLHLTDNAQLTFRVNLPVADRLTFRLFNVLGQEKASWQMSLLAGEQNIALPLDLSKLAGGIHFIQAEWRGQRVTRKWMVVR